MKLFFCDKFLTQFNGFFMVQFLNPFFSQKSNGPCMRNVITRHLNALSRTDYIAIPIAAILSNIFLFSKIFLIEV